MATPSNRWNALWMARPYWLYKLYSRLDNLCFPTRHDAFARVDLSPLLAGQTKLVVKPRRTKFSDYFSAEDVATLRDQQLDVLLRFGFRILRGEILQVARYGIWSYHHGDNLVNRGGPPGFWEVMENEPVTGSVLQVLSEDLDAGQVLYRSYAATNRRSVKRNKNHYYWKSSEFVLRKLADVHEHGAAALAGDPYAQLYQPYDQRLYRDPVNREFVPLFLKFVRRALLDKVREEMTEEQWFPAYQLQRKQGDAPASTFHRFQPIQPPPDRYWADPFPVHHDGTYYIFVEEYLYGTRKGHVAVLALDADGNCSQSKVVLQRPYHLSYPFVFQWQGNTYMIPETAQNRTVELYRCVAFPDQWELEQVLLQDVNAVDATLTEIDGRWWMFVNIAVPGMATNNDELHLFYAETPLGPWQPHRRNPIKSDCRSARPAGRIFTWHGDLYRPAQDCSVRYGHAITLHKIEQIDPDCYVETAVSKIMPTWAPKLVGTHTLNHVDGLTVIDGLRLQPKWLKRYIGQK